MLVWNMLIPAQTSERLLVDRPVAVSPKRTAPFSRCLLGQFLQRLSRVCHQFAIPSARFSGLKGLTTAFGSRSLESPLETPRQMT
jgi:hypothetical protein